MRWLVCAAVIMLGVALLAQDKKSPQKGEDEELMQEELDWLKRAWEEKKKEHREEFGEGASESEGRNALEQIIGKMKVVERRLAKEDVGKTTQRKEVEIIKMLNDLIRKIEERAQSQSQSQSQQQQKQKQKQQGQQQQKQQQQKRRMSDPNRSQNAQPGSQRAKAYLKKVQLPPDATGPHLTPRGARSGWSPVLPHNRKSDADAGAAEKFPHKFEKWLKRYYKLITGRKK